MVKLNSDGSIPMWQDEFGRRWPVQSVLDELAGGGPAAHPDLAAHTALGLSATHAHDFAASSHSHPHAHSYASNTHSHTQADVTNLVSDLAAKAASGHNHDAAYSATGHTHAGGSEAFPVGSVFIAVVNTNPATLLGYGTWAAFGVGRFLIGTDTTAEQTAGSSTHSHTFQQPTAANESAHTHTYTQVPNHVHVERAQGGTTGSNSGTHLMTSAATGGSLRSSAQSTLDPTGGVATGTTAAGSAHTHTLSGGAVADGSTAPPSITAFFWKRTA